LIRLLDPQSSPAVFLDVAKDRLYTLAPADPRRRSAQTVLWRALHDLAIAASPALAFTADEVWQHHPALLAETESVHLARWPEASAGDAAEWTFLMEARDAANAAIEPLRAAGTLKTTAEAALTIAAGEQPLARLARYRDELPGFLIVAAVTLAPASGAAPLQVTVERTPWSRCERCWTHRDDVDAATHVCARCATVLRDTGRTATVKES